MKRILFSLLAISAIGTVGVLLFWSFTQSDLELVRIGQVQLATLRSSVSTNGKIEAEKVYEIRAPLAGTCRTIGARAGDAFEAGRPIVTIGNPSLDSELAAARADLEGALLEQANIRRGALPEEVSSAAADVSRLQLEMGHAAKTLETNEWLAQRQAISRFEAEQSRRDVERLRQQLDAAIIRQKDIQGRYGEVDRKRAASRVEAAQSRVRFLEASLERSVVRAPVTGVLYRMDLHNGVFLNTGDLIGLFADIAKLRVRAFVDEPELGRVEQGAEVEIRWDALPQETWTGRVISIPGEVVTRGTRSVAELICSIESPRKTLLPNVSVDVEILTKQGPQVPALPRGTVFLEGKEHYVWVVQNDRAVRRTVETGRGTAALIEITKGLAVGDSVIIPGEAPISEGKKVRVAAK